MLPAEVELGVSLVELAFASDDWLEEQSGTWGSHTWVGSHFVLPTLRGEVPRFQLLRRR